MEEEVEGLSTAETAESLSISEDLVKTRLHRARAMLRDNLYKRAGITVETLFVMTALPTLFRSSGSATA